MVSQTHMHAHGHTRGANVDKICTQACLHIEYLHAATCTHHPFLHAQTHAQTHTHDYARTMVLKLGQVRVELGESTLSRSLPVGSGSTQTQIQIKLDFGPIKVEPHNTHANLVKPQTI